MQMHLSWIQMHGKPQPARLLLTKIVTMQELTLISHTLCPYVQRAVIALTEKGIPFERIDIDLANKPDWFLKISPLGKVPVLIVRTTDGEAVLFESNVICEYIEDTQSGP